MKAVAAGSLALACARADAQPAPTLTAPAAPPPVASPTAPPASPPAPTVNAAYAPPVAPLNPADSVRLRQAIEAAQSGDTDGARNLSAGLSDPVARRLVLWAMIDAAGSNLSFFDLDTARRDLWGWPRPARRETVAEKSLEAANLSPQRTVDWFEGREPETAEGAMALASAYQQLGRQADAADLIRHTWRAKVFNQDVQARMMARYGVILTPDDHAKRLDMLLLGPHGPASRAMLDLVSDDVRQLALARIALRADQNGAVDMAARLPASVQDEPGLALERARYLRKHNLDALAAPLVKNFPTPPAGYDDACNLIWSERRAEMMTLLHAGDARGAYEAAANNGLPYSENYTEAEFFAGWIALRKLNDPAMAAIHFANIRRAGTSPITVSRALYWQGRAAEAAGDMTAAKGYWAEGAKYYTAFYGQLSAEKAGQTTIALPRDPTITSEDRARFEGREVVRAARMLADMGSRDLFRSFVLTLDDTVPDAEELALLVDMARLYGDQDLAMRVVRAGAVRGLYLPERGYPIRMAPQVPGAAEPALVHAIIRQESGFDPVVRSGPGARGMMQLMPATAANVARKLGMEYSANRLNDPDYNMELGSAYLGDLVSTFSGSYVMAAAGYNAGPGRPAAWAAECGDPRGGSTDPSDFIECIPFAETRNYVMRIMEATQIYRARLNGGTAPLMAMADLKRGGYGVTPPVVPYQVASIGQPPFEAAPGSGPGPVPYAQLAQREALEDRAREDSRVDVAARSDHERGAPAKVERAGKKGGKSKGSARLEHKSKVSKGKGKGGQGGGVRRHKARR